MMIARWRSILSTEGIMVGLSGLGREEHGSSSGISGKRIHGEIIAGKTAQITSENGEGPGQVLVRLGERRQYSAPEQAVVLHWESFLTDDREPRNCGGQRTILPSILFW
ncbi:hypothetical protein FB45DRAFT_871034 [Roridomyces roridus]|uniref:Uncharacterized protein n=1 Tax=Roridomyces roridus TaxID=1738132 RepID=A0AAD7BHQ3_9AGAR|nr:hypothetical protein FB45DRAFT_871034 [Roridomyces roridus]